MIISLPSLPPSMYDNQSTCLPQTMKGTAFWVSRIIDALITRYCSIDPVLWPQSFISVSWNRGVLLYTEVSSFQGVGIEEFYCIQRCPHFRGLE